VLPLTASSSVGRSATGSTAALTAHDVTCHSGQILTVTCTGNTAVLTGSGNQVDGLNSGQCSAFGGGTDDDTLSPGDND
jgi:hypothetical protein